MKIQKTRFYSWKAGSLAKGCRQCVKGEKLVLFITGLCANRCDFCPLSDKKLYKDVVYANERPVTNIKQINQIKQIIEEAKACKAKGAGITGGDPLMKMHNTCSAIRKLKSEFGKDFHIHLYTPLVLVNKNNLKQLFESGLDEIRFHPKLDINKQKDWEKIMLAKEFNWDVGVEVPVIPGKEKETKKLIDFIAGKVDFLNLNELELADNAVWRKNMSITQSNKATSAKESKIPFETKDKVSYAIKGSEKLAKKMLKYAAKKGIKTHYCTCKLKDKVQLANRILRRAKNTKLPTDKVTKEGMLIRGALYLKGFEPGFGYHRKIENIQNHEKRKILNSLNSLRRDIIKTLELKEDKIVVDKEKLRLLTSENIVRSMNIKGVTRAVITEYPTFDSFEIEVDIL